MGRCSRPGVGRVSFEKKKKKKGKKNSLKTIGGKGELAPTERDSKRGRGGFLLQRGRKERGGSLPPGGGKKKKRGSVKKGGNRIDLRSWRERERTLCLSL